MDCPKCLATMTPVSFESIEFQRCVSCKGMWFDMLVLEDLKALDGSEAIDVGDPKVGKLYNEIDKIKCPKCHTDMIRMVDKDQHHIWYEACSTCYGVFFDAGEFKDYKEDTMLDYFKDLFTRERKL